MNRVILLVSVVQAVCGSVSHYFVRPTLYPSPAGVLYSGITTALPPLLVPTPTAVPDDASEFADQRPANETTLLERVKTLGTKSTYYDNTLETRFNGVRQHPGFLYPNYPACYTPVLGPQPVLIQVPFNGLQTPGDLHFTPQAPPFPLVPPFGFEGVHYPPPQYPGAPFLPPQIPAYPTVGPPPFPPNFPSETTDDGTDSVVVENPELDETSSVSNTTEYNDKQILDEFRQRLGLRELKKPE